MSLPNKTASRCQPWLGTFVEITVDGPPRAIDAAFAAIAHVHKRMSFHNPHSDLGRLRAAPPGENVVVDPQTVEVLRAAIALHEASEGLFDVSIGRALVEMQFLPGDGLAELSRYTGTTNDIRIVDRIRVACRRPVLLDLGGIAKGYAVDRAIEAMEHAGASAGMVNAGGDLRVFGGRDWPVGLRDADGLVRTQIALRDVALASSANLEDRREVRGRTYSPHVGPDGGAILTDRRISVVAERCMIADALTKVAMTDPALAEVILSEHGGHVLPETTFSGAA